MSDSYSPKPADVDASGSATCSAARCKCGSKHFVWWISEQGVCSSLTDWTLITKYIDYRPRCVKCNREVCVGEMTLQDYVNAAISEAGR